MIHMKEVCLGLNKETAINVLAALRKVGKGSRTCTWE